MIFGYTIANDITARDLQKTDGQWARAKGFDTFCPLGPAIETEFDVASATLETRLNGEVAQRAPLTDMIHSVADIIAYASAAFTLLPGDVILTGTPVRRRSVRRRRHDRGRDLGSRHPPQHRARRVSCEHE